MDKLSIFQGSFRVKLLCVDSELCTNDLQEHLKTPIENLGDGKLMTWLVRSIADHVHSIGNVDRKLGSDLFSHALFAESKGLSSVQVLPEIKSFNIGSEGVFLEELMCKVHFDSLDVKATEDSDAGSCDSHGRPRKKCKVEKPDAGVFLSKKLKVDSTASLTFFELKTMVKDELKIPSAVAKKLIEEHGYTSKATTVNGKASNLVVNRAGERMGLNE